MREDLLYFIWKNQKFSLSDLQTAQKKSLLILDPGQRNTGSGPDFFNAKIVLSDQLWVGHVEIHRKSSDWYAHHHEKDKSYDAVILHVVWEDNLPVFDKNNVLLPTLELQNRVSVTLLATYKKLFARAKTHFINCERDIKAVNTFIRNHWLERLYFERLELKTKSIKHLLKTTRNNWEQVLFIVLCKGYGLKANGPLFHEVAESIPFSVLQRLRHHLLGLESVLYGMVGLLNNDEPPDRYYQTLRREYHYLHNKFGLKYLGSPPPEFFRQRPSNFPTLRLSQLANLLHKHPNLFDKINNCRVLEDYYKLFETTASPYWDNHYVFGKRSRGRPKKVSKYFIDLLLINSILPLKFCYFRYLGYRDPQESIQVISSIKRERNHLVDRFGALGVVARNAMESQALLRLHSKYCIENRCLQCAIGHRILHRK